MDFNSIWMSIKDFFTNNFWGIVKFVAIFVIGLIVVKLLINISRRLLGKTKMEKITQQFLMTTLKLALYLVFVLILLGTIGIEVTGIITALSAAVLAIGMALQSIIANVANGIVIVATKMFKKGDFITVDGQSGGIVDINFLFTTIKTGDNRKITIPNSMIVNNSVVNAGANPKRRVDFTFQVAYESDVEAVKKIVLDVMKSNGKVDLDPEPFCRLKTLGASSLDFFANCWCDSEDYWDVYYYVIETVYNEFKKNNIMVPYAQLEVRSRVDNVVLPFSNEELPERVEKQRVVKKSFDFETADFSKIFHHKNSDEKKEKKPKKQKASKKNTDETQK